MPRPIRYLPKLPPDPDGSNKERRTRAMDAVIVYAHRAGLHVQGEDIQVAIGDLLCDLAHLCDDTECNLGELLVRAKMHYEAETGGKGFQIFSGGGF